MTLVNKIDPRCIRFDNDKPLFTDERTREVMDDAAQLLRQDQVVAFPTETVYGLGANCKSTQAVRKIYEAKNRPADNPLIIHVSSLDMVTLCLGTTIPEIYWPLIRKFWPGPLTVLLPLPNDSDISPLCTKGQNTFGCRMPAHPIARALIAYSGMALAAPSANASTRPSCTEAKHVLEDMQGRVPLILDGGASNVGVESTVVDGLSDPPRILRPGGVSLEDIIKHGGPGWINTRSEINVHVKDSESVKAPGMKYKHYSPRARVVLVDPDFNKDELEALGDGARKIALLSTLRTSPATLRGVWPSAQILHLPLGRTKSEISHSLFARFRDADNASADLIVVEAVDTENEGLAIMNRLNKAAETYVRAV